MGGGPAEMAGGQGTGYFYFSSHKGWWSRSTPTQYPERLPRGGSVSMT